MHFWNELGLPPTTDARAIKRAYAQRLKVTRPEDDPAAFQRLRAAFETALAHAERRSSAVAPRRVIPEATPQTPVVPQDQRPAGTLDPEGAAPRPGPMSQTIHAIAPVREAAILARAVLATLTERGDAAAAAHLDRVAAADLVDLELRDLFESELLNGLRRHPVRPLELLTLAFHTFHWDDNRHPLRRSFGDVFAFASRAREVGAAQARLARLAADEDPDVSHPKAYGRAARLLLSSSRLSDLALLKLDNNTLDALASLIAQLRARCGDAIGAVVPPDRLAYWQRVATAMPRRSGYVDAVLAFFIFFGVAALVPGLRPKGPGTLILLLLISVGSGIAVSWLFRWLAFRYETWTVPDDSPLKRWRARILRGPARSWLLLALSAATSLGMLLPSTGWSITLGVCAFMLAALWINNGGRGLFLMLASMLVAALVRDALPRDTLPWAHVFFIQVWIIYAAHGLWLIGTGRGAVARVWRPLAQFRQSASGRMVAAGAASICGALTFGLSDKAQFGFWALALLCFGQAIKNNGVLLRCAAVGFILQLSFVDLGIRMGITFFAAHLLSTAVAYGLFRGYERFCARCSWVPRTDGFFVALGLIAVIGSVASL